MVITARIIGERSSYFGGQSQLNCCFAIGNLGGDLLSNMRPNWTRFCCPF